MTVKELKEKLENMNDNLIVTICDSEDDSNESWNFKDIDAIDTVKYEDNKWVAIFFS